MKIAIVSTNFSPAFIGHMKAWFNAFSELGADVLLYFDEEYVKYFDDKKYRFTTQVEAFYNFYPDYAILQNPGMKNMDFVKKCNKNHCKLIYILHEPFAGMKWILSKKGNVIKFTGATILNFMICHNAYKIVLCSDNAKNNFKEHMKIFDGKDFELPLLFNDQYIENCERKYFSYIGGLTYDHASDEFINFIKDSYEKNDILFQIATRNSMKAEKNDPVIKKMVAEGRLIIQEGTPLTEDEMNNAYRRSIAVWNGYRLSTQSGVIANAFMQGTPSLATRIASFEKFVIEGKTGAYIENYNYDDIYNAYKDIERHVDEYSKSCRNYFLQNFYYKSQLAALKKLVDLK